MGDGNPVHHADVLGGWQVGMHSIYFTILVLLSMSSAFSPNTTFVDGSAVKDNNSPGNTALALYTLARILTVISMHVAWQCMFRYQHVL